MCVSNPLFPPCSLASLCSCSLDGALTWTQLTGTATFPARAGHASAVLPGAQCGAAGCILLLAGRGGTATALNDVWLSTNQGTEWRRMTSAAAFAGRVGAKLAVSAGTVAPPTAGSLTPQGSLVVLAGGVGVTGADLTDASAWLSYDGGWSWSPLLPITNAASFPYSFSVATPYFDSANALIFLGVQFVVVNTTGTTTTATTSIYQLTPALVNDTVRAISSSAIVALLNYTSVGLGYGTVTKLTTVCFFGLNCFPAPSTNASVVEAWLNGTVIMNNHSRSVQCGYISGGCTCASYSAALSTLPTYYAVKGKTSGLLPGGNFSIGCTSNASLAADGYLFNSATSLFAPYPLLCQWGGVYSGSLPPSSYCTSSYIASQGTSFGCLTTTTSVAGTVATPVLLPPPVTSTSLQSLTAISCYFRCGCLYDLSALAGVPLLYTSTQLSNAKFTTRQLFSLTLCGNTSSNATGAVRGALQSVSGATFSPLVVSLETKAVGATVLMSLTNYSVGSLPPTTPPPFVALASGQAVYTYQVGATGTHPLQVVNIPTSSSTLDPADAFDISRGCPSVHVSYTLLCDPAVTTDSQAYIASYSFSVAAAPVYCLHSFTVAVPQACGAAVVSARQPVVTSTTTCPSIACPLPDAPANGGVLYIDVNTQSQLTTTVQCDVAGATGALAGPATQVCRNGLFSPALPGQCVQFTPSACRVVAASNTTQVTCAVNEIVVGGGGDCTDYDLNEGTSVRSGLSVNQPLSSLQGWEVLCVQASIAPLSVYARCCLADESTFLFTPAAYLSQTSLSFSSSAASSFQQCERVTAASALGTGTQTGTLTCPTTKQLIASGVECPSLSYISSAQQQTTTLSFSCTTAIGHTNTQALQAVGTAICCEAFAASVCTPQTANAAVKVLSQSQVLLQCPAQASLKYDPLILVSGPAGVVVWTSAIPLGVNASVLSINTSAADNGGVVIAGSCHGYTFSCCYLLPKVNTTTLANGATVTVTAASSTQLAAQDYCPFYSPVVSNGIGTIVSNNPDSPAALGTTYTLTCPTPYSYLSGAAQVTCSASGRWQGYLADGTVVPSLGVCEVVDTTECITVEARSAPPQTPCAFVCGCYADLSADLAKLPPGGYSISGPNIPNLSEFVLDICLNPLGNDHFTGCGSFSSNNVVACMSSQSTGGAVVHLASQPYPDASSYITLGTTFGGVGNTFLTASFSSPAGYATGLLPATCAPQVKVTYKCGTTMGLALDSAGTNGCTYSVVYTSPSLCVQPQFAAGAPATSAANAALKLQCPTGTGVNYVMTQAGASCTGNAGTVTGSPVLQRAPLVASSMPTALDTWSAVCYDNSNLQPTTQLRRFYAPTDIRGVCCPTQNAQFFSTCRYNSANLTCDTDEIAVVGGANCQTADTSVTATYSDASNVLQSSYNLGLFQTKPGAAATSVLSTPLNQWTVACGSTSGTASAVALSSGKPQEATICCANLLQSQPAPVNSAPVSYVAAQALSARNTAQMAVSIPSAMGNPAAVIAALGVTNGPTYRMELVLSFTASGTAAGITFTSVTLFADIQATQGSGSAFTFNPPSFSAQLVLNSATACVALLSGTVTFPITFYPAGGQTNLWAPQAAAYSPLTFNGLTVTLTFPISNTNGMAGSGGNSFSVMFTSPHLLYTAAAAAVQTTSIQPVIPPLAQQVCYATSGGCKGGEIQLASSAACASKGGLLLDYPLVLGTTSIVQQSHQYECAAFASGSVTALTASAPTFQAAICCAAYDLCHFVEPLPSFVDQTQLQLSFPDSTSTTARCLAGYGFPGIIRAVNISCDISSDGQRSKALPPCEATACSTLFGGLSPELPGGNGRLSTLTGVTGDVAYVECNPGYALASTAAPSLTCTGTAAVGGSDWQPAPPASTTQWCVLASSSLTLISFSFPSQYSYMVSWSGFDATGVPPSTSPPMWNLTHTLQFPSPLQLSTANAAEKGLLVSQSVQLPISTRTYTFVVDSNAHIEGTIAEVELYAYIPRTIDNTTSGSAANLPQGVAGNLYTSQIVAPLVELPCGCDVVNNPTGAPQGMSITQSLSTDNSLTIHFLPQSLCNPNYQIVQVNESTGVTSATSLPILETYYAESADSCPFLTEAQAVVGTATWQLAGQVANYCVTAVPQPICTGCVPLYTAGVLPPFGTGTAPDITTCASLIITYYVPISGHITTPGTSGAAASVANVTVTAVVVDTNNVPMLFYDEVTRTNVTVTTTTVTDTYGQFSFTINSTLITTQYVAIAVTATRVDIVEDTTGMLVTLVEPGAPAIPPMNYTRVVQQSVQVASNTTVNANVTELVLTYQTISLTPGRVLQMPVGTPVVVDDGSSTTVTVTNHTSLSFSLNTTCPAPVYNHSLTTTPTTQLASMSPYALCAIMVGPASNRYTVSITAVVYTSVALTTNTTDRTGIPDIGAGWVVNSIIGYRVFTAADGTVSNTTFQGAISTAQSISILYPFASIYNAYDPSGPLGVANDIPSQEAHVLDSFGIPLTLTVPSPVEGLTGPQSSFTLRYDATAGANGQYTEGPLAAQPSFSSLTYVPLINQTLLNCVIPAVVPPPTSFSPSLVTTLGGSLLSWLSFDSTDTPFIDQANVPKTVAAVGSAPPSVDSSSARFGDGSLQGNVSGTTPSYLTVSDLEPFGSQLVLTSASISVWVRFAGQGGAALLQPIMDVRAAGAPLISLSGANNGSHLVIQFVTMTSTGRGAASPTIIAAAVPITSASLGWSHVVLVWDASNTLAGIPVTIYVNASVVRVGTVPTTGLTGISATEFNVGGSPYAATGSTTSFTGHMDELMVFSAALTAAQATQLFLYNLPFNAVPDTLLGHVVRATPVPSYTSCDLIHADSILHTVRFTTTTNTTTTVTTSGVSNRTSTLSITGESQLQWTLPWSVNAYNALFNYASQGSIGLNLSAFNQCIPVNSSSAAQLAGNDTNDNVCAPYPTQLLSQLAILNGTVGSSLRIPIILDAQGHYLSPYLLYGQGIAQAHSVLLPAGVVNSSLGNSNGKQLRITASPLSRVESLTQAYSNGDVLSDTQVNTTLLQLSIINSTTFSVIPATLTITTTQLIIYLSSGMNLTTTLSNVISYTVIDTTQPGQTDPSWPIIVRLANVTVTRFIIDVTGVQTVLVTQVELITITISSSVAVFLNTTIVQQLQKTTTTTSTTSITTTVNSTSTTVTTTTITIGRMTVPYNFSHVIIGTSSGGSNHTTTITTTFGQDVPNVNFQDNSTLVISGTISFGPNPTTPGIEHCGVQGVVVQAFAPSDTNFNSPLSSSPVTGVDGQFAVGVTVGEPVVLRAAYAGNLSLHTFSPSSLTLTVGHSPIAGVNFLDTTTHTLTLSITGGMCAAPVGNLRPVLILNSCGGVHIPLTTFGSTPRQFNLPAIPSLSVVGYTADTQDASGLQIPDPLDSAQAQYRDTVNAWLINNAQLQLNLSISDTTVVLVYTAPTTIDLVQPTFAKLPCSEGGQGFDVRSTGESYTVVFALSQLYGIPGVSQTTCGRIDPNVVQLWVHDDLSDDLGNTCVIPGCALPPVYSAATGLSIVTYSTVLGVPYLFTRQPNAPDYTRDLRYGIAGTFDEEVDVLSVLITGSVSYAGVDEIVVPPENTQPLYILRRPPGGTSMASYSTSYTLTTTVTQSTAVARDTDFAFSIGAGIDLQLSLCLLFGFLAEAGQCQLILDVSADVTYSRDTDTLVTNTNANSTADATSYTVTFSTTDDQFIIDGDGDSFLLLAASINQSLSTTLSASVPTGQPPLNPSCDITPPYDTPTASFNPSKQLIWFSRDQIENVEIPAAQRLAAALLGENGGSPSFLDPNQALAYTQALQAGENWEAILALNEELIDTAVAWPDLLEHVAFGNASQVAAVDLSKELDKDTLVFTFAGDAGAIELTVTDSHIVDSVSTVDTVSSSHNQLDVTASATLLVVTVHGSFTFSQTDSYDYSVTMELNAEQDTTLDIVLSDPDEGDQFSVAVLRDTMYGSPVYRTLAGRSHCLGEANTVFREQITATLTTNNFIQVPPNTKLSTTLIIQQDAPFQNQWDYFLNIDLASNTRGLIIEANGVILAFNAVLLTLGAGEHEVNIIVYREDGAGYDFPDINIGLSSADCPYVYGGFISITTFSVSFIPECAALAFVGDLRYSSTFTVNAASHGLYTFTISNPDAYVTGRSWESMVAAGILQSIRAQYKPSAGNQAEWEDIPIANGLTFAPLSSPLSGDVYAFTADLSQLPLGSYDFRLLAQCTQPVQVTDSSLYQSISPVVTAVVDLQGPSVVTYLPAVQRGDAIPIYYPGEEITVSFNEDVVCLSTAGQLVAVAVVNATQEGLLASLQAGVSSPGSTVPLVSVCEGNRIEVAFSLPNWAALVGQFVAIQVSDFTDAAGNFVYALSGSTAVTWGFQVAQFDYAAATVAIRGVQLRAYSSAISGLIASQLPLQTPTSSTAGVRRLLAEDAEGGGGDAQPNATAAAVPTPQSLFFADAEAAAFEVFRQRLEAQVQREVLSLVDAWRAQNHRSPSLIQPAQIALANVRDQPVSFDIVLLPAAAGRGGSRSHTISPAEAAHEVASAIDASLTSDGRSPLTKLAHPLLSLYAASHRRDAASASRGSNATTSSVSPLRIDIAVSTPSAPSVLVADLPSALASSATVAAAVPTTTTSSSTWILGGLCAALALSTLLITVALVRERMRSARQKAVEVSELSSL